MNDKIYQAFRTKLNQMTFRPEIHYLNEPSSLNEGTDPWLKEDFLPAGSKGGLSFKSSTLYTGLYQVAVYHMKGTGPASIGAFAARLCRHFKRQKLNKAITITAVDASHLMDSGPWAMIVVSVRYKALYAPD